MIKLREDSYSIPLGDNYILCPNDRIEAENNCNLYYGKNSKTGEKVAIKLERITSRKTAFTSQCKILIDLQNLGYPIVYWYGKQGTYNVIIMELLGQNLRKLFELSNRQFNLKTSLLVVDQMLQRVRTLHSKGYLHRDIKPGKFALGIGKMASTVYLTGLNLIKAYVRDSKHIPYSERVNFMGTSRYASIFRHQGIEQSRRDDLESLIFIFIYFINGELPWQGLKAKTTEDRNYKVLKMKLEISNADLCKNCPKEIQITLEYIRALKFEQNPDYDYISNLFSTMITENNVKREEISRFLPVSDCDFIYEDKN